jgi:hypothetical protein
MNSFGGPFHEELAMSSAVRSPFYLLTALFVAVMVLGGFTRTYYLREFFDRPPLTLLLHLHALAFTAWIALLIIQIRLVAARRLDLHRRLGVAGAMIAVVMVVTAGASIVEAMRGGRVIVGMPAWQFVALSTVSISLFAVFVGAALALRRRPDWHKRLIIVATLGIMGPGVGRLLVWIFGPAGGAYANLVLFMALVWCLAYDWFRHRQVHPAFVIGTVVLMAAIPLKQVLAHSKLWADFAARIIAG